MPIEIKELMIEVKVSSTIQPTTQLPVKGEVIAECMDQVMTIINTSRER